MHPILIQFTDSFFVGTYGVLIALGLLAAVVSSAWRGRRLGISSEAVWDMATICIFAGFGGARVVYILQNFREFLDAPLRLLFSREGFVFYGGLGGATLGCLYYLRRQRIDKWVMSELVAVALPLAQAFGRLGCHFAGCCFGSVCGEHPLGIHVPLFMRRDGEYIPNAFVDQVGRGLIASDAAASLAVWPVQLFEAVGLFAIAGGIAWFFWRRARPTGVAFGTYLVAYGVLRFCVEFLRGDEVRGLYFGGMVSFSQLVSIGVFAAGLVVLRLRMKAGRVVEVGGVTMASQVPR